MKTLFVDHYKVLSINKTADGDTIKKSYRKLALKFHPDICKLLDAQSRFIEIHEAYEILSNITKRHYYDILWESHYQPKFKTRAQEIFEEKVEKDYQQWRYQANKTGVELAKEKFDKVKEAVFEGVGQAVGGVVNFMSFVYLAIFLIGPFIGIFVNWTDYKNGNEASLTGVIICSILSALILFFTILHIIRTSRE